MRGRHAEQPEQVDLASGGVEQIGSAHHVGDARIDIVHDHRELVSEQPVGAQYDVVAGVGGEVDLLFALDAIDEADPPLRAHAPRPSLAPGGKATTAGARIASRAIAGQRLPGQFAACAGARIRVARCLQSLQRGFVGAGSLALPDDLAVPCKAEALERMQDARCSTRHRAWSVHILDPQQPFPSVGVGVEKAARRGDQRSEVQRAAGRGRKAADVRRAGLGRRKTGECHERDLSIVAHRRRRGGCDMLRSRPLRHTRG